MDSTATDGQQAGQPLGLGLSEGLGPTLEAWAKDEFVQFVSRSDGQRTTATVSRDALLLLMDRVRAAERKTCEVACAQALEYARSEEADRWTSRVDGLSAKLRGVDARYWALVKAVADGRAMQPAPPILVSIGPNDRIDLEPTR